ncbi:MAG: efflux RND transporter periplasmic adaptor subunit [Deltaproteobacteria bacterium]|nr:efflux RND transporter periplasmic adaptor subunit [Deltaproteobacteria bacterium]
MLSRNVVVYPLLLSVFSLGIGGCHSEPPPMMAMPPPTVTISQPVERAVIDYDEYTGRTAAVEEVEVRARVSGYLIKRNFKEGSEVQKGDLLFLIDPRPFQTVLDSARGHVAQWEAKRARAEADVARNQRLLPKGAASQKDLDNAMADLGEAHAAIQSGQAAVQRAALDLEFTKVTAPISGRISRTFMTEGNLVNADATVLTTIVSLQPMYAYFDVDERSMLRYQQLARSTNNNQREARLSVSLTLANEEGGPQPGTLDFIDNRVDSTTGTIRMRGVFPNTNRTLTPGLFVRIRIPGSDTYQALLVTDRAISTDQGQKHVWVVNEKNVVEYRPVNIGAIQSDGLRVVKAGLKPEEWLVTNGLQRVRPGVTVVPQRGAMPTLEADASAGAATVAATKTPAP